MNGLRIVHSAPAAARGASRRARRSGMAKGWPAVAGLAGRIAARIVAAIAHELRIRRDTRQLMAMSDHMLKDIGLRRADIGEAVRRGRD